MLDDKSYLSRKNEIACWNWRDTRERYFRCLSGDDLVILRLLQSHQWFTLFISSLQSSTFEFIYLDTDSAILSASAFSSKNRVWAYGHSKTKLTNILMWSVVVIWQWRSIVQLTLNDSTFLCTLCLTCSFFFTISRCLLVLRLISCLWSWFGTCRKYLFLFVCFLFSSFFRVLCPVHPECFLMPSALIYFIRHSLGLLSFGNV